jgi:hypothetical protein
VGCDVDALAGAAADALAGADVDALAGADAVEDEAADEDEGADDDEDADAGALSLTTGANGSWGVACAIACARFAGAVVAAPVAARAPVAAPVPVAGEVVTDVEAGLDDEPEPPSSFGSWKARTPAKTANSATRRIFLRRSATLRAATRRVGMCVVLMSASSRRQTPSSKSR